MQNMLQYVIIFDRQKKNACSPRAQYICQIIWHSVVSFCVLSLIVVVPDNRAGTGYQGIVQTAVCQPSEMVSVEQIKNVFLIIAHQYGFVDREDSSLLLHPPVRHALNVLDVQIQFIHLPQSRISCTLFLTDVCQTFSLKPCLMEIPVSLGSLF